MKGKKLLGIFMSVMMVYSIMAPIANAKDMQAAPPYKPAIVEKLKEEGKIPVDATQEQIDAAFKKYIKLNMPVEMEKKEVKSNRKKRSTDYVNKMDKWDGTKFDFKPLVILMDFENYPNEAFPSKEKSPLTYKSFPKSYYENMMFAKDTYKGPNGEDFISFNKFYTLMSGGSHGVNGKVFGWYHAKEKAAFYGGNGSGDDDQINARKLIVEALDNVDLDPEFDVTEFDKINNDTGDKVPDGIIDQIIVVHAGRGEEMGGGSLKEDAIWPFRSWLDGYGPGSTKKEIKDTKGNKMDANDFLIVEQDCTPGLVGHEFGHIVGAPDEYGEEEPVQLWSLMAGGSYTGELPGTRPVQMSPFSRDLMQKRHGGNWLTQKVINFEDIDEKGIDIKLHQSFDKKDNNEVVRINLPQKETVIVKPFSGKQMYFSGCGDDLRNSMSTTLDLTGKHSAELTFKTYYKIDPGFDFASVQVKEEGQENWTPIKGNITTTVNEHDETPDDSKDRNPGHGITNDSGNEWVDARFNLSAYANKKIELKFYFWTDTNTPEEGMYIDDIKVIADGAEILKDDAEGELKFNIPQTDGFSVSTGTVTSDHYYLVEWRNGQGQDDGLNQMPWVESSKFGYDPGMLIWYVDDMYYTGNRLNQNSGNGNFGLGVVDADQTPIMVKRGHTSFADDSRFQVKDAAFSLRRNSDSTVQWPSGDLTIDTHKTSHPYFDDRRDYLNSEIKRCGRNIPNLGLKVYVTEQSQDDTSCTIRIRK